MRAIAIIPARLGAQRFPGKPLAPMLGMPMVGHCYFRTRMCSSLTETYVATCDEAIADYVRSVGGKVVMTAATHTRASGRTAEAMLAVERESGPVDVVVMVQGDEPLLTPELISETLRHFAAPEVEIVNIMSRLRTVEEFLDHNNVKVVVTGAMDALYMSREPIPSPWRGSENLPMYMQVGVIGFRREALIRFNATAETRLEQIESIDMNRVLESGGRIRMVATDLRTIGVDTPAELAAAAERLRHDPLTARYLTGGS
jgi:3-deoxy-manno-octulosonate cytidylyltransferase (CMP-KDO synthetase)